MKFTKSKYFRLVPLIGLIVSLAYIFYSEFIRKEYSELTYFIENEASVYNLKPLKEFGILDDLGLFPRRDGTIYSSPERLRIATLRIENTGNKHITENSYYSKIPFGFEVSGGYLIQPPEVSDSSIDSIEINFIDSLYRVELPKIPLDVGDYYKLNLVYISLETLGESTLKILPIGKISGIKSIKISKILQHNEDEKESSLLKAIPFLLIGLLIIAYAVDPLIQNFFIGIKRKNFKLKILKKFEKIHPDISLNKDILHLFLSSSNESFIHLESIFTDNDTFDVTHYNMSILIQGEEYFNKYRNDSLENIEGKFDMLIKVLKDSYLSGISEKMDDESGELRLKEEIVNDMKKFFAFLKHQ